MATDVYAVVLAGGQGTRLWPLSRRARPKQIMPHPLTNTGTLLRQTIKRLLTFLKPFQILVVTSRRHLIDARENVPPSVRDNIIVEEEPRGTAAAIALAVKIIFSKNPASTVITINSDASIGFLSRYRRSIQRAIRIARRYPHHLILIGVPARTADTSLGYIIAGSGPTGNVPNIFRVQKFIEKPTEKRLRQMLATSRCFANPSIVVGSAQTLWEEFRRHTPAVAVGVDRLVRARTRKRRRNITKRIPVQSIDVGVLERSDNLLVLDGGDIGWSDIGQWGTIHNILAHQAKKSVIRIGGAHLDYGSHDVLAYNTTDGLIATVGLDNVIIVSTNDVILISDKRHADNIKRLVQKLRGRYARYR